MYNLSPCTGLWSLVYRPPAAHPVGKWLHRRTEPWTHGTTTRAAGLARKPSWCFPTPGWREALEVCLRRLRRQTPHRSSPGCCLTGLRSLRIIVIVYVFFTILVVLQEQRKIVEYNNSRKIGRRGRGKQNMVVCGGLKLRGGGITAYRTLNSSSHEVMNPTSTWYSTEAIPNRWRM